MNLESLVTMAASEGPAAVKGVLDASTLQVLQSGFDSLSATVNQVLVIAVPCAVGIIALTGGVRYALKKVRGVIASAA